MAVALRTYFAFCVFVWAAISCLTVSSASANNPIAIIPENQAALEILQQRQATGTAVTADWLRLGDTAENLCDGPFGAVFPDNVYKIPPDDPAGEYPQVVSGAGLPDPDLKHEPLASGLRLQSVPSPGASKYLLTVQIFSDALFEDVGVSLRIPEQVIITAIDRELSTTAVLEEYLAVTPNIRYRDYSIGNAAPIGKLGTRQFRFMLENLPELGQLELRVSAKDIEHHQAHTSYSRLAFADLAGRGTLYASPDLLSSVLEAELHYACENKNKLGPLYRASTLLGDMLYGKAVFVPDFSVTGPSTAERCLQGTLEFSNVQGGRHPVPGAAVHLVDGLAGYSAPILSQHVDASGNFKFEFDAATVDSPTADVNLNLVFETEGVNAEVFADNAHTKHWGIGLFESAAVDLESHLVANQCVNIGTLYADSGANQENNYAFEIFSALHLAKQALADIGGAQDQVTAVYPTPAASGLPQSISLFQPDDGQGNPRLVVAPPDPHSWDTLYHEYGHFLQHARGMVNPMPGVPHFIYQNHCESIGKQLAIEFAWYEAWPTALGMVLQKQLPEDYWEILSVGDGAYSRIELDGSHDDEHFDPEALPLPSKAGEATEAVITAALWELYENASFRDDYTEPDSTERILTPASSWLTHSQELLDWHLSGFNRDKLPVLAGSGSPPAFDRRIGGLWSRHRVGPSFLVSGESPPNKLSSRWLFSLVNGPNCDGQLLPDNGVNYFVRVYAADYQSIVWEGVPDDSPVVAIPVSELNTFLTGSGETLHWHPVAVHPCEAAELDTASSTSADSCDTGHASYPGTGPYVGTGWTMVDDVPICPAWLFYALAAAVLLLLVLVVMLLRTGTGWIALLLVLLLLALLLYRYWHCLTS